LNGLMIAMMSFMDSFPLGLAGFHAPVTSYAGRRHAPKKLNSSCVPTAKTARKRCGFQPGRGL
jgi:hypothetical protein